MVWDKRRCTFDISDNGAEIAPEDTVHDPPKPSLQHPTVLSASLMVASCWCSARTRSASTMGETEGGDGADECEPKVADGCCSRTVFLTARSSPWGDAFADLEDTIDGDIDGTAAVEGADGGKGGDVSAPQMCGLVRERMGMRAIATSVNCNGSLASHRLVQQDSVVSVASAAQSLVSALSTQASSAV